MAAATEEGLRAKILDFLKKAGSPQKVQEVAKHFSILKAETNKHLYAMEKMKKVKNRGSGQWEVICESATGEDRQETTAPMNASTALVPVGCRELIAAPCSSVIATQDLTEYEEKVLSFLRAYGGRRRASALDIAKGIGMKTAKDVNPGLYSLREKGLLDLDEQSKQWLMKGAGDTSASERQPKCISVGLPITSQYAQFLCSASTFSPNNLIVQINPTNIINQQGEQNTVNISDSQNTQVGSGNTINVTESDGYLPGQRSSHGPATGKAPTSSTASPGTGSTLPEAMNFQAPTQNVNIIHSKLNNSIIGSNNTILVNYQMNGAKREDDNMEDNKTWTNHTSAFDEDSHKDNFGWPSENGDPACTTTKAQGPSQNISINDSIIKNTVIANDTRVKIDDRLNDSLSGLVTQTQGLRLENDCTSVRIPPSSPCKISITDSQLRNANFGSHNCMNIQEIGSSEENSEAGEEEEESNESGD